MGLLGAKEVGKVCKAAREDGAHWARSWGDEGPVWTNNAFERAGGWRVVSKVFATVVSSGRKSGWGQDLAVTKQLVGCLGAPPFFKRVPGVNCGSTDPFVSHQSGGSCATGCGPARRAPQKFLSFSLDLLCPLPRIRREE